VGAAITDALSQPHVQPHPLRPAYRPLARAGLSLPVLLSVPVGGVGRGARWVEATGRVWALDETLPTKGRGDFRTVDDLAAAQTATQAVV
jgi:hypothetical protein